MIHAGLYYPPGSLKAQLCVAGREMLYAYCLQRGITHKRVGKLIVATQAGQEVKLDSIMTNALACGVRDISRIDANEARALEPQLQCVGALVSPSTGIIDSHALMHSLQGDAQSCGVQFAFKTTIEGGEASKSGITIDVRDYASEERFSLKAERFVNAAGTRRSEDCALNSWVSGNRDTTLIFGARMLFRPFREVAVLASGLSHTRRRRARRSSHTRYCRPSAIRSRRRMGE